jgi:hypothetical protein
MLAAQSLPCSVARKGGKVVRYLIGEVGELQLQAEACNPSLKHGADQGLCVLVLVH